MFEKPNKDQVRKNTALWYAAPDPESKYTKIINIKGGRTTIDAQYQLRVGTELFGPLGLGWGLDINAMFVAGPNLVAHGTFWYKIGEEVCAYAVAAGAPASDEEAPKKILTQMRSKGLSMIGIHSNVFLGMLDSEDGVAEADKRAKMRQDPEQVVGHYIGMMSRADNHVALKRIRERYLTAYEQSVIDDYGMEELDDAYASLVGMYQETMGDESLVESLLTDLVGCVTDKDIELVLENLPLDCTDKFSGLCQLATDAGGWGYIWDHLFGPKDVEEVDDDLGPDPE